MQMDCRGPSWLEVVASQSKGLAMTERGAPAWSISKGLELAGATGIFLG